MTHVKVGVQLWPQATTMDALRAAAVEVEQAGADSLWTWDHFFPIAGEADGAHFECFSTLAAFASETERVQIGSLVSCVTYRNPDLLADMARTLDHIARGRMVLGLGAGWFERDFEEYGYAYQEPGERLAALEDAIDRIEARLERLTPPPVGDLPILIGGGGEEVTLRIVAEHADMWNGFADTFVHKNAVLDDWCEEVGRDAAAVERTVLVNDDHAATAERVIEAGAEHVILGLGAPFDLAPLHAVLAQRAT